MGKIGIFAATACILTLSGCGKSLHDTLAENYPTYLETAPASSAYAPGRIYLSDAIVKLPPVKRGGLERVVFPAPCRPKVNSEVNSTFNRVFTQNISGQGSSDIEIPGVASLRSEKSVNQYVKSVTMTVDARHILIGSEDISLAQSLAREFCPNTLENGVIITQAIMADIDVSVELKAGVDTSLSAVAEAVTKVTGNVGFGISATSNTHTSAENVIVAVKYEDASRKQ